MSRLPDKGNPGVAATLGQVEANHAGARIDTGTIPDAPAEGSSGNPGTELPWQGADSTAIGADTQLPPLKSL